MPPQAPNKSLHIVQVTDCHLGEREGDTLLGMDTDHSLVAVLDQLRRDCGVIDLLVVSGDLSSNGQAGAYHRLLPRLGGLAPHLVWLPGNHDDVALMRQLAGAALMPARLELGGWQLLFLDSAVPGQVGGKLAASQLLLVEQALQQALPTLIFLHHHLFPVGCQWLDEQRVENAAELQVLLQGQDQVKAIVCGHVHQESDIQQGPLRQLTTPSSCIQFAPGSAGFALDSRNPGYRYLELAADGSLVTQVRRVQGQQFKVDRMASGYQ